MLKYYRLYQLIKSNPFLIKPNIITDHVSTINYNYLKSKGIKYIVFDRDNTLSAHLGEKYFSQKEEETIKRVKSIFQPEAVALLSNSLIKQKDLIQLDLPVVYTKFRKPYNYKYIKDHFKERFNIFMLESNQVAIVGDRLFTDVVLANMNGCVSILVKPLDSSQESVGIRFMRFLEGRYNSNETMSHPVLGELNKQE